MLIIENQHTNPYINIALEEYFLKQKQEEIFMLWRNTDSIIIGKHQNPYAEINSSFVRKNSIPIIRRLSGGGTVFHDLGNLNYTFLERVEKEKRVNFRRYTNPILETLISLGVSAYFEGKSNLRIDGLKFSGNAEHLYKDMVLHHGTLLLNSNLNLLNNVLKNKMTIEPGRAVKSDRTIVTNLSDFVEESKFVEVLLEKVSDLFPNASKYKISQEDINNAKKLVEKKYNTFEWNYGYSPPYKINFSLKGLEIFFEVENGIIKEAIFLQNKKQIRELSEKFIGRRFLYDDLKEAFDLSGQKDIDLSIF